MIKKSDIINKSKEELLDLIDLLNVYYGFLEGEE